MMFDSEFDRLLDKARQLLGAGDDALLGEANHAINQALTLHPESIEGWLVKCQVCSAHGDDIAALSAVEMAIQRAPERTECLYWRGAILGDLGRHREALRAIERALRVVTTEDTWMLEDLYFEKASLLEALGLFEAAHDACEVGLQHCPGSALLRSALAPVHRARVRASMKLIPGGT